MVKRDGGCNMTIDLYRNAIKFESNIMINNFYKEFYQLFRYEFIQFIEITFEIINLRMHWFS